jgi:hypothetical protein
VLLLLRAAGSFCYRPSTESNIVQHRCAVTTSVYKNNGSELAKLRSASI